MGLRGPAPTPRESRIEQGMTRRDRMPAPMNVGEKALAAPLPPADMPGAAVSVWNELAPMLVTAGLLASSDLLMLEALCSVVARARRARCEMEGQELTVDGSKGMKIVNPLLRVERDAWAQAHRLAVEFGLTPSARARLGIMVITGRSLATELEARIGTKTEAPLAIEVEVID